VPPILREAAAGRSRRPRPPRSPRRSHMTSRR
jgi:hypothetical protein